MKYGKAYIEQFKTEIIDMTKQLKSFEALPKFMRPSSDEINAIKRMIKHHEYVLFLTEDR